jgi:hypothetical protein
MWSQLTVSLVFELGLHKHSTVDEGQMTSEMSTKYTWLPPRFPQPHPRTTEERRAVLGVFHVTSMQVNLSPLTP